VKASRSYDFLYYDRDHDLIAEHTEWLAQAESL
jgi:hypothetical protein